MAAIVTGQHLGLIDSSGNVLGGNGQLGSAATGLGGDGAHINAATGNLTLQRQDELLLGLGPDIGVVRTYNSQGSFDFDANVDNWQLSLYRRVFDLTGSVNTTGSTVKRTGADGAELTYTYDADTSSATYGKYINKDGAGSFDVLSFDNTNNEWTWQDGDSRISETYELQSGDIYRINTVTDTDGNALSYTYNANNLITQVQSANGGRTELIYNGSNHLTQVNVVNSANVTTTRARYTYDGNGRLETVSTDLTPVDGDITDGNTYVTTYAYDGASNRITSILNNDGTGTSFTYDGVGRIQTVTNGTGTVTIFNYVDANTTTISVTDNNSQTRVTTLTYDSNQQLTRVQGPAGSGQDVNYSYDADGNVSSMTDSRGHSTNYQYDANGNRIRQEDSLGNTITWTYDNNNQVLTETTYTQADTNPGDSVYDAASAQTTRYAYDSESHLRFMVSAEGRVTEYRYAADGTRTSSIDYTDNLYTTAGNITETQLAAWIDSAVPAPSPAPGPSPTPSPSPSSGSGSSVIYSEDFNGATSDISIGANGSTSGNISIVDANSANGRLVIKTQASAQNSWPGFSGSDVTYAAGQVMRAEISFGANSGDRDLIFGISGEDSNGNEIYHRLQFGENSFNAGYYDATSSYGGSWNGGSTGSSAIEANTTYIVEFETAASSTTTYVYKQGETRADGWSYEAQQGVTWATYHVHGYIQEQPGWSNGTEDSIDNIQIVDTTASGSSNASPTVTLSALNATYAVGEAITLTATAADSDGTVASVSFYDGSTLLSTVGTPPYTYVVNNATVGDHAYTAVATDDDGATMVSTIAAVTVNAASSGGGIDKTNTQRTDYSYDVRGQLSTLTTYTAVDSNGNGVDNASKATTQYVYDQYGNLTQTVDARGVATTGITDDYITSYAYDGLHRLTSQTDAQGHTSTTIYDDNNRQVQTTLANGLVTTSSYDLAGRLVSVSNGQSGALNALGTASNLYDDLGQVRRTTDATGQNTYYLYDDLGRKVGEIDPNKNLTEYVYNDNGQISKVIQYDTTVTATLDDTTALTNTIDAAGIRITSASDRISYNLYDDAGRLVKQINAVGAVTTYQHDGANQLIGTVSYANLLTNTQMNALAAQTTAIAADDVNSIPVADGARDRITRSLYSADGLLVATLDAEGYLTEHIYDAAGQLIRMTVYATAAPTAQWAAGDLAALRPTADAVQDQTTHYLYNARGQLEGTVDPQGYLTEYQYDLAGNRTNTTRYATAINYTVGASIADSRPVLNTEDQSTSNSFDGNNRLTSSSSQPDGLDTTYTYDAVGNLLETVNSFTGATSAQQRSQYQQYDLLGRVTASLSGEGVLALQALPSSPTAAQINSVWDNYGTRYTYDLAGRVVIAIAPNSNNNNGNRTLYYYDDEGKLIYEVNALGEVVEYGYNSFDQRESSQQYKTRLDSTTLDAMTGGFASDIQTQITTLAAGGTSTATNIQYDNAGRIISTTDALNDTNSRTYNAFGELATTTTKIDDSNNVVTSYAYDERGLVTTTTEDGTGLNRITQAIYDAFGRITQTTDGEGGTNTYTYDRLGREVQVIDASNINSATIYDAFSRVLTRTDGRNNTTTYGYDSAARTMTMTTSEGISLITERNRYGETVKVTDGNANETTYTYNADGQLKSTTTDSGTAATPTTSTSTNDYDSAGQLIKTTDARGVETDFTYDAANRLLSRTVDPAGLNLTTNYSYDALGRQTQMQDANGIWTHTNYNDKGRVTSVVVDPTGLNLTTNYTYSARGKRLTVTEGVGSANPKTTQYVYDKLGRLSQSIVDPGTGNGELNIITAYQYDQNDNVVLRTDANGNQTVYAYDANNRLTHTVDPLGYVTSNSYDDNGNITQTTAYATALDGAALTALQADPSVAISVTANAAQDQTTQYVYDQDNRNTQMTDALGHITQYAYDANGNQITVTEGFGSADVRTTTQVFDAANRKTEAIDAEGNSTKTKYDAVGNIITVTDALNQVGYFYYDTANRMTLQVNPEGAVTARSYDALGNIIETIRYANKVTGATESVQPAIVADSTQDQRQVISYDAANRKDRIQTYWGAGVNDYYTESMTYDARGNVLTETARNGATTTYTYDVADRKATETLPITSKDVNGNDIAVVNTFAYDGMGNLTSKIEAAGLPEARTTSYTYTQNNLIATESMAVYLSAAEPNVTATKSMTYDARSNVSSETDANGNVSYYYYDNIDRQVAMVDANNVLTTYVYDAVGNKTSQTTYANPISNPTVGTQPTATADAANDRTMTYGYDGLGREVSNTIAGMVVGTVDSNTNLYNAITTQSLTQTTRYDANGNIVEVTDANGNSTYAYYNNAGEKVAEVDAAGYLTVWSRDAYGNVSNEIKFAANVSTVNLTVNDSTTLAQITTAATTLATAGSSTVTGDRSTAYTYDRLNRITTETKQDVAQGAVDTTNGQLTQTITTAVTSYQYNGLNNITQKTDALNNISTLQYDGIGRLTQQQDPSFTDSTGATVRTTTDMTYDGLNNVSQVIARGADNATEADDQITTYTYATGGRLASEADALGITTNYAYDANGNLTQTTLVNRRTADQVIADTAGADDVTNYTYDNLNRQLTSVDVDTRPGVNTTNAVTYNSFGEVIAKSTYEGTAPTNADEFVEYDRAGRVFKTNSEDGIVKVMIYDANGNATMRMTSSDNTTANINTVQNTQAALTTFLGQANTLRTMSLYDDRNQLTKTIQATMDANRQLGSIVTSTNSNAIDVVNPLMTSVNPGQAPNTIESGNVRLGGTGSASWNTTFIKGPETFTHPSYTIQTVVNVPSTLNLTGENIIVNVYITSTGTNGTVNAVSTGYISPGSSTVSIIVNAANGSKAGDGHYAPIVYTPPSISRVRIEVVDSNAVKLADQAWAPVRTQVWVPPINQAYSHTGFWRTVDVMPTSGSTNNSNQNIYIKDQPSTTERVLFSYNPVGANVAATTVMMTAETNTSGQVVPGIFKLDWASIPAGNYEYSFTALDAEGLVVNQQSGSFDTDTGNTNNLLSRGEVRWNASISNNAGYARVSTQVSLPNDKLSEGTLRAEVTYTVRNVQNGRISAVKLSKALDPITNSAGFTTGNLHYWLGTEIRAIDVSIYESTASGEVLISQSTKSGGIILGGTKTIPNPDKTNYYSPSYITVSAHPTATGSSTVDAFYVKDQPAGTDNVSLSYRLAGSADAFQVASMVQLSDADGNAISGAFSFDSSSLPAGVYEYTYTAADVNGAQLNQKSGTFDTEAGTTESLMGNVLIGGLGRAFISDAASTGLTVNGLQLVNQGNTADTITMRYRVKGSTGAWSTIASTSFVKSAANVGYGLGHFSLATADMSVFANDTTYEVELEVSDADSNLLRVTSTEIARDASGALETNLTLSLNKLRLGGEPTEAAYMDIAYREQGSAGAYSTPVRVYATATGSGSFDWDIAGIPLGNQDIDIKSYDSNDVVLNHYQAFIDFSENSAVVNNLASLNKPRFITINPPQPQDVEYVIAGYRPKDSNVEYILLPITAGTINATSGEKEFNVEVPLLDQGDYEYSYTAYGVDTDHYVDSQSITITPPPNTQAGTTPAPAPSPAPGPSPTPSPSSSSGSGSSVLYSEDFNGASPDITTWGPSTAITLVDTNTSNGRLVIAPRTNATEEWPGFRTGTDTNYAAGQLIRAEVSLGALITGNGVSLGMEGQDTNGNDTYFAVEFDGDGLFSHSYDEVNSWGGSWQGGATGNITLTANTNYIVEFETAASSATVYVYKQGETRADGWSHQMSSGTTWATYRVGGSTYEGPSQTGYDAVIDNITIEDTTTGGSSNASPTVTLAGLNATYAVGEAITLTATAADSDGTVASVSFYDGSTLLSTVGTPPYTYVVNNATVGDHAYTAVATDDDGATIVSTIAAVTVNAASGGGAAVQAKYGLAVDLPVDYVEGDPLPEPTWITTTVTAITMADGSVQYQLDIPSDLAAGQYVYEYQTYTLVTDQADPNYNTYQWTDTTQGSFESTAKQNVITTDLGAFTIDADSIDNTQTNWVWNNPNATTATIAREQSFNAFGEIASETDGRGNVTSYTYNTLGGLTRKQDPTVSITTETGQVQDVAPVTTYTYDAIGRTLGITDANGNTNTQTWVGNSDQQLDTEYHADGGKIEREYDTFGNLVSQTDEIDRTTNYIYDKNNQLVELRRPSVTTDPTTGDVTGGAVDRYTYDEAGNRVAHTNALNGTSKTDYDSLGRVTQTRTNLGFATTYSYEYSQDITGLGGETMNGWVHTTANAVGRTIVDKQDMFGRTYSHKDLGDHLFTYNYNEAGWLESQTGSTGQDIVYDHYNNGFIKSIHDRTLGMYTHYEYDADGNKSFEGYVSLKDADDINGGFYNNFQQATITYDALNRMTSVTDLKATITYTYDAVGNRRSVKSEYRNGVNSTLDVQEYWYQYDSMNRFVITKGAFDTTTNTITIGNEGSGISYDLAGQRRVVSNGTTGTVEAYTYNDDGYLTDIHIDSVLRARRTNDLLGRTTNITEYASNGSTVSYSQTTNYDADNRTLSQSGTGGTTYYYYYNDASNSSHSQAGAGDLARTYNINGANLTNTYYSYEYWDDAKVRRITTDPYNSQIKDGNARWGNGYSDIRYDVNGHISAAVDRVGNRNIRYVSDAQGILLVRDEITGTIARPNYRYGYYQSSYNSGSVANKVERFYYVDGVAVGGVGNDGPSRVDYVQSMANRNARSGNYANWRPVASADFDQNYEPISPTYPGPVSYIYTVKAGDTLQSIALTVWGDASMWYLVADANGIASGQQLEPNMELIIPNKVTNIHNNAGTYRPYNPGEAIGDLNPTIPATPMPKPKKSGGCGGFGIIIAAVVAVVATVLTAGALAPVAASIHTGIAGIAAGTLAGAVGSTAIAIGAVAGAVGSIAGQVAGNVLGVQDGFSWGAVATAAIGGVFGGSFKLNNTGWQNIAKSAAISNAVGQGLGIITGQQKDFSWSSLAVSAISAPIGNKLSESAFGNKIDGVYSNEFAARNQAIAQTGAGFIHSATRELTRVVIQNGKVNWVSIAADTASKGAQELLLSSDRHETLKSKAQALSKLQPVIIDRNGNTHYFRTDSEGNPALRSDEEMVTRLNILAGSEGPVLGSEEANAYLAEHGKEDVGLATTVYFEGESLGTTFTRAETDLVGLTSSFGDPAGSHKSIFTLGDGVDPRLVAMVDRGSHEVNPLLLDTFLSELDETGAKPILFAYGSANNLQNSLAVNANMVSGTSNAFVWGISNPTTSFVVDNIIDSAPARFLRTRSTNTKAIQSALLKAINVFDNDRIVDFVAHSESTIHASLVLKDMSIDQRSRVSYTAIGNATDVLVKGLGSMNLFEIDGDPVAKVVGGNLQDREYFRASDNYRYTQLNPAGGNNHSQQFYLQNKSFRDTLGLGAIYSNAIQTGSMGWDSGVFEFGN